MMRRTTIAALAVLALGAASCRQAPAPVLPPAGGTPISEADAGKIADATLAAWTSKDAARIKARYAPDVDGFDYALPGLAGDRATWDKRQDAYVAAGIDGATQKARKIQPLSADVFVVSGVWDVTSSKTPANNGTVRCTDVYRKDQADDWLIVNEHCSLAPRPA